MGLPTFGGRHVCISVSVGGREVVMAIRSHRNITGNYYYTILDDKHHGSIDCYDNSPIVTTVDVTFVCQLCNSRLQRHRRFLKGVPALNDKRSIRGRLSINLLKRLNEG